MTEWATSGPEALSWDNNVRLIHKSARAVLGRCLKAGITPEYEDIFQALCVTYVTAKNSYDAERQVKFSTYLVSCMNFEGIKIFQMERRNKYDVGTISYEDIGGEDMDFLETIPDSSEDLVGNIAFEEAISNGIQALSDRARLILDWLVDPPEFVEFEMRARAEKGKHAFNLGFNAGSHRSDLRAVLLVAQKVFGISGTAVNSLRKEIHSLVERI